MSMELWGKYVKTHYPDAEKRAYFVPPIFYNKILYIKENVDRNLVYVRVPPEEAASYTNVINQLSDLRDDAAHSWFLRSMKVLSMETHEIMMVISHLHFKDFLIKNSADPRGAARAEQSQDKQKYGEIEQLQDKTKDGEIDLELLANKKVEKMKKHQDNKKDGEIDVLIVHPEVGLVVVEIKSVGAYRDDDRAIDFITDLKEKVQRAVKQLKRAEENLKDVLNENADIKNLNVPIILTLILPFVKQEELALLRKDTQFVQDLRECFGCKETKEAFERCLCGELSPVDLAKCGTGIEILHNYRERLLSAIFRAIENPRQKEQIEGIDRFREWWTRAAVNLKKTKIIPDDGYKHLLGRFCRRTASVKVPTARKHMKQKKRRKHETERHPLRTTGEAVAYTGLLMTDLFLVPEQLKLIKEKDFITIRVFLYGPPGTGKTVCLILKGAQWRNEGHDVYVVSLSPKGAAVSMLIEKQIQTLSDEQTHRGSLQSLHFNVISISDAKSAVGKLVYLAEESRKKGTCAHFIIDEVAENQYDHFNLVFDEMKAQVPNLSLWAASIYLPQPFPKGILGTEMTCPLRCTPVVQKEVSLSEHMGDLTVDSITPAYSQLPGPPLTQGNDVVWLHHACYPGHDFDYPENCKECGTTIADYLVQKLQVGQSGSNGLQHKDILILCNEPREDSGMVQMLRKRKLPLQVLTKDSPVQMKRDVALAESNTVTITDHGSVSGLERSVVIGMGPNMGDSVVHTIGRLSQPKHLMFILSVILVFCLLAELIVFLLAMEPRGFILMTVFCCVLYIAAALLSIYVTSKMGGLLHGSFIGLVVAVNITIVVIAYLVDKTIAGLLGFTLYNIVGGIVGSKFANIFPVMTGIVVGSWVFGSALGGIIGGVTVTFFHNTSVRCQTRIARGLAIGITYTSGEYNPFVDSFVLGTVFTFMMNGFWTGMIVSMLVNMVMEIRKVQARNRWYQYALFLLAAVFGLVMIWSLLSRLPLTTCLLMIAGMAAGVYSGITVESIQTSKSLDRLYTMSRSTALLVWIDEPVPRPLCL